MPSARTTLPRFGLAYRLNNADSVVILEGFNDILYAEPNQGIAEAELGVRVLAASARGQGARVFIALLTPTKPGRRMIPLGIVQAANDRLRQVARNEGAIVIDTFTPLLADLNGNIGSDGLHLTALGYRRLAEVVFAAIRAELEVRLSGAHARFRHSGARRAARRRDHPGPVPSPDHLPADVGRRRMDRERAAVRLVAASTCSSCCRDS